MIRRIRARGLQVLQRFDSTMFIPEFPVQAK